MYFETCVIDLLKENRTILPNQMIRKSSQKITVKKSFSKYLTVLAKKSYEKKSFKLQCILNEVCDNKTREILLN